MKNHLVSGVILLGSKNSEVILPWIVSKAVSEGLLRHVELILHACSSSLKPHKVMCKARHHDGMLWRAMHQLMLKRLSDLAYEVLSVVQHLQTRLPDAIQLGEVVHTDDCCARAPFAKASWRLLALRLRPPIEPKRRQLPLDSNVFPRSPSRLYRHSLGNDAIETSSFVSRSFGKTLERNAGRAT